MNKRVRKASGNIFFASSLTMFLLFVTLPLLWAVSMSFKRDGDVFNLPLKYIPDPATIDNYINSWRVYKFSLYFKNSLFITVIAVLFILLFSLLNGYALSRFNFKGKSAFMIILLCTQMIPAILTIIPLFIIFRNLGLINNPASIIIAYIGGSIPFNTLLMLSFINNVPRAIDEAALIDGCGRVGIITRIIFPNIRPGIVATCVFAFIGCWNEFFTAFAFIMTEKNFTIPVALRFLMAENVVQLATLAAQCIIAVAPPLILFMFIQKYLIQGLSAGSVKG